MTTANQVFIIKDRDTSISATIADEHPLQRAAPWIWIIDFALFFTVSLLIFSDAKIFCFHLVFIFLTVGAFYWQLNAFILRATITVVITTAAVLAFVLAGNIPGAELVEIPMLATILVLVFAVAWQRTKAEDALRRANEELEKRVFERTADLSKEIGERQKTEQILRESEERYRHLVQLSFEAIAIHTEDEIIYFNPAGMKLLGVTNVDELQHKAFLDFVHPDCAAAVQARLQQIRQEARGAPLVEEKFLRLDGDQVDVEIVTIPIAYQGRAAMQTVIRDITVRKQMEQARIAERMSIARDLHDSLGQSLGYLHLKLDELVNASAAPLINSVSHDFTRMRDVASNAYEQVRGLLASLMSANTMPLAKALRDKAKVFSQQAHFCAKVINRGQENELPPVLQQQILWLCSEALTNIVKHAAAQQVKLELWWSEATLTITIEDDGSGFDSNAPPPDNSYGLRIMHERALQMGGLLFIQSQPGAGTQLMLQVPLPIADR